jgi:hypothetical protein
MTETTADEVQPGTVEHLQMALDQALLDGRKAIEEDVEHARRVEEASL